jgi:parvulin-like peptidyl-prolyl isomerase
MLESFRRWSQTWPAKIVLGLIVLSMVAFLGVDQGFLGGPERAVLATVGGSKVRVRVFRQALNQRVRSLEAQLGRPISMDDIKSSGLAFAVLRDLVTRTLLDEEAKRLGLAISDDLIRQKIKAQPFFHDDKGVFSKDKFKIYLRNNGLEERTFLAEQRAAMKRQQIVQTLKCLATAPRVLSRIENSFKHQKRLGGLFRVTLKTFELGDLKGSNKDIQNFYNENPDRFAEPMKAGFSAIVIGSALWKDQKLSESEVRKKLYNLVEAVEDGLYGGLSMAEAAKKYGLKLVNVPAFHKAEGLKGDLQFALPKEASQALVDYVFSDDVQQKPHIKRLSPDVQIVLEVNDVRPSFVPPLKVGTPFFERVRWTFQQKERQRLMLEKAKQLAKEIETGQKPSGTLLLKGRGVTFETLPAVTMSGGVSEVAPQVKTTLFMMSPGQVRVVKKSDGEVCLVKLLNIEQPKPEVLDKRSKEGVVRFNEMLFEDFVGGFLGSLRAHHHVQIHREVLTRLLS